VLLRNETTNEIEEWVIRPDGSSIIASLRPSGIAENALAFYPAENRQIALNRNATTGLNSRAAKLMRSLSITDFENNFIT